MEQTTCPKCGSEQVQYGARRLGAMDVFLGGPAVEFHRINSKYGTCGECKYHWKLSRPDAGHYIGPRKQARLVNGSFLAILGIIFILIGIFAMSEPAFDVVVWRWIILSIGGLLLSGGIFFMLRALHHNKNIIHKK